MDHTKGEMTGDRHYSERAHSPCKLSILIFGRFYKKNSFSKTQTAHLVFSFVVLHVQCNPCLCD